MTNCATISEALDDIDTLAELTAFAETIMSPPPGAITKKPTDLEWQRIARMKIDFQRRERKP